jgi:hypothetical protein
MNKHSEYISIELRAVKVDIGLGAQNKGSTSGRPCFIDCVISNTATFPRLIIAFVTLH